MAQTNASGVHLVRVITDDRDYQFWVAATSRDEAVSRVLDCIPEGWAASLLDQSLEPNEVAALNIQSGNVRELRN